MRKAVHTVSQSLAWSSMAAGILPIGYAMGGMGFAAGGYHPTMAEWQTVGICALAGIFFLSVFLVSAVVEICTRH